MYALTTPASQTALSPASYTGFLRSMLQVQALIIHIMLLRLTAAHGMH
jgi:hypothetical protein